MPWRRSTRPSPFLILAAPGAGFIQAPHGPDGWLLEARIVTGPTLASRPAWRVSALGQPVWRMDPGRNPQVSARRELTGFTCLR